MTKCPERSCVLSDDLGSDCACQMGLVIDLELHSAYRSKHVLSGSARSSSGRLSHRILVCGPHIVL